MLTLFLLQKVMLLRLIKNRQSSSERHAVNRHANVLVSGLTIFLSRQAVIQLRQACCRCVPEFIKKTQSRIRPTLQVFFGLGGGL